MSDVTQVLTELLRGGGTNTAAVLHNCRFQGAGASAYGRDAIVELLRERGAFETLHSTRARHSAALFASSSVGPLALFADLYGEYIGRLWYLGPTVLVSTRPERVDVPFDLMTDYGGTAIGFDPADHRELHPTHASRVRVFAERLIERCASPDSIPLSSGQRLCRLRPTILRAFSCADSTQVLMVLNALRRDAAPGLVQFTVAAHLPSDVPADAIVVVDEAQCEAELARAWCPVI